MRHFFHDAVVVGAGPAGATAARRMAENGMAVALLERRPLPHDKACGGGLTCRLPRRFPELAQEISSLARKRVDTLHFHSPDGHSFRYTHDEPISLMTRRRDFDAMLIDRCRQAGAEVFSSRVVTGLALSPDHAEVRTAGGETFRARAVVGADGVNGIVARASGLRGKWPRGHLMAAVVAECPIRPRDLADPDAMSIFFGYSGSGYGWVFPKEGVVNVGLGAPLGGTRRSSIKAYFDRFLRMLAARGVLTADFNPAMIRGGLIPCGGVLPKTQTGRVLLCGDAAGFVHALTGEGIHYAMVSGDLAAKTLVDAWREDDWSEAALGAYQASWQREIGIELADSVRVLHRSLATPWLVNEVARMVGGDAGIQRLFTDYFMGKLDHDGLKRALKTRFLPRYLAYRAAKLARDLPFLSWMTRSAG